jgi:hypothetical protein
MIKSQSTDLVLLNFNEIIQCQILGKIINKNIVGNILIDKTDLNCCFQISRFNQDLAICAVDNFRCLRSKAMIIKHIISNCPKTVKNDEKQKDV